MRDEYVFEGGAALLLVMIGWWTFGWARGLRSAQRAAPS